MTFLRIASTVVLPSLLAACGGADPAYMPVQTAAATIEVVAAPATAASATVPAPNCAAEGCASLRIIDGNAEAWRIDAARRAALEARLSQS
ncbi:hypothetical protein [Telluria beijingensis]|uniref:hypothetical protein n=1 Tax=Telluria beijingensis TaxID=3068633 RepID=UPI0027953ED7|nr:hypothetical protein [Massilia sp. REN29]